MGQLSQSQLRLGKIGFLNILPIYFPLEAGIISHPFEIISGIPAYLNGLMSEGKLDLSVVSSIEYARSPERYFILPDLSISCSGAVKSVLLLSRAPIEELDGETILLSAQSHTSVALLKILFSFRFGMKVVFKTGNCTEALAREPRPTAFLAIGDEALRLKSHEQYPYRLDLSEAWREWTGLPFVFALWVVQRQTVERWNGRLRGAVDSLLMAKAWGYENMDRVCSEASKSGPLSYAEFQDYYSTLDYNLDQGNLAGLESFYRYLFELDEIKRIPALELCSTLDHVA